jgi:hypothetical protein
MSAGIRESGKLRRIAACCNDFIATSEDLVDELGPKARIGTSDKPDTFLGHFKSSKM